MVLGGLSPNFIRTHPGRSMARLMATVAFEGRPYTARFQTLDRVTLWHLRRLVSRGNQPEVQMAPIFIVGIGRSGTTLLGRLLSAHSDVGLLNEPKAIWHVVAPNEDVSGHYASSGRFLFSAVDVTDETRERAQILFGAFARYSRSNRVVDKYPEMAFRIEFLKSIFPDCKVIAIVRRPEDVVRSIVKFSDTMGTGEGGWWGVKETKWQLMCEELLKSHANLGVRSLALPQASPEQRATAEWIVSMEALLRADSQVELIVRYEDLLATPAPTIRHLLDAVGLRPSPTVERYAESETRHGPTVLNSASFDFGENQSIVDTLRSQLGLAN